MLASMLIIARRVTAIAGVAAMLVLAGCAATLESTADKCGGISSGIRADDSAIVYVPADDRAGDGLTCIVTELFADGAERFAAVMAYDGEAGTLDLTGYTVKYGTLGGQDFIAFSPR